jgi:hypothetical protein
MDDALNKDGALDADVTLEYLLRRMRFQDRFPGLVHLCGPRSGFVHV